MQADFISIAQACELLNISRPTLDKYRKDYELDEVRVRGQVFLSKLQLIETIIYAQHLAPSPVFTATAVMLDKRIESLFLTDDIVDLRGDVWMDAFGIISLLCKLKSHIKEGGKNVYVLVGDTPFCRRLKSLGFFNELEKSNVEKVFYRKQVIPSDASDLKGSVILPLHSIGYRGAEKKLLNELYDALRAQGFSENISSYLGWVVGELSDNSHTHSKGGPCYLMIESLHDDGPSTKFLSIVIGDIGVGIQKSLKSNPKYALLSDEKALVSAFLSDVSSWADEHKRGKGLNDVMGIALGNQAWLRCEANGLGLFANFQEGAMSVELISNLADATGTRVGIILIDNNFRQTHRVEVNQILQQRLGSL